MLLVCLPGGLITSFQCLMLIALKELISSEAIASSLGSRPLWNRLANWGPEWSSYLDPSPTIKGWTADKWMPSWRFWEGKENTISHSGAKEGKTPGSVMYVAGVATTSRTCPADGVLNFPTVSHLGEPVTTQFCNSICRLQSLHYFNFEFLQWW